MFTLQPPRHIPTLPIAIKTRCPRYVRSSPNLRQDLAVRRMTQRAMYGRRPRCKRNLTYLRMVRVQPCMRPVFRVEACPVAMQPLWLLALM